METQNVPAVQSDIASILSNLREVIPAEKQVSWLQLCNGKATILSILEKKELELQALLLDYDKKELLGLQTALEAYKKGSKEMPELRKGFTMYLDKITAELMLPEKRVASFDKFALATARYNELRIQNENKAAEESNKKNEQLSFVSHTKNQYVIIASTYGIDLNNHIAKRYAALLEGVSVPDQGLEVALQTTIADLESIKLKDPVKFEFKFNTREEIGEIWKTIVTPDYKEILATAISKAKETFKMYNHDKANALQAKVAIENQFKAEEKSIKENETQAISVNNLLAMSGSAIVSESTGVKQIKRSIVINCQDLTPQEAVSIVSSFIANWTKAAFEIKVKQWSNLKVEQMAGALDSIGVMVDGVRYKEIVK